MNSGSPMDVVTFSVGQGSLAVVRSESEAVVVDCRIPPRGDDSVAYVKLYLSKFLKGRNLRGLILTGFDKDHADVRGVAIVLRKYRPEWIMYPDYEKDTQEYEAVMELIADEQANRSSTAHPLHVLPITLAKLRRRRVIAGILKDFDIELFSPHPDDMDSSNNCGIVCKFTGTMAGGFSYLVTGDTEQERWEVINRYFGGRLESDVVAVPHHGSKNGTTAETIMNAACSVAVISAGVNNQFDHPHPSVVKAWRRAGAKVLSTNENGGQSLVVYRDPRGTLSVKAFELTD